MRNRETGKKLCGVLLIGLLLSGILSGCAGTAKYQVMELEQTTEAEMAAETAEPSAISAAGVGSVSVKTDLSAETEEAAETEVPTETEETEEAGAFDEASERSGHQSAPDQHSQQPGRRGPVPGGLRTAAVCGGVGHAALRLAPDPGAHRQHHPAEILRKPDAAGPFGGAVNNLPR